jgi:hypothetical protein
VTTILGALDPRVAVAVAAGYSPDMDVVAYHGNHPCWLWINANIREYVDTTLFHALRAPGPLVVLTGKKDGTYSNFNPPFAADKQVLRRSHLAYDATVPDAIVHYMHFDVHRWHAGDVPVPPVPAAEEMYVRVPLVDAPAAPGSQAWQSDATTALLDGVNSTIFDVIDAFLA